MDFWVDIAFAVLLRAVKNAVARATMRAAFIKLVNAIASAYSNDPEFWASVIVQKHREDY